MKKKNCCLTKDYPLVKQGQEKHVSLSKHFKEKVHVSHAWQSENLNIPDNLLHCFTTSAYQKQIIIIITCKFL